MAEKLAAVVLGNRNAGKSTTWNTLFQRSVKTGRYQRELHFNRCEYCWVFLVSGSPEDSLGLIERMLSWGATVKVTDGREPPEPRVREMRNFIYGWAKPRGLITENQGWA